MRKCRVIILLFLMSSGLFLFSCGPGQYLNPTPTSLPSPAPSETTSPVPEPTATEIATALKCEDEVLINSGDYRAENNTWGKGDLSGWSQCIGLGMGAGGTLAGRWTWNWLNAGNNVKAYPEIVFGQKPGSVTTSAALPVKISAIRAATIAYDVSSTYTGSGDVAFDIWLTDTPNPSTWGVPPITHEIMIWLDRYGNMQPGGAFRERVNLDGTSYAVYVGDHWGQGWQYIAFASAESRLGSRTLDLGSFLSYLREKKLVNDDEYLASVEFGNEVATGTGETVVKRYTISIQKK